MGVGITPIAFVRAFPLKRATLCSEPVVAWAHFLGHQPVSRKKQIRLWRAAGCAAGADRIAAALGLAEIAPGRLLPGDAALFEMVTGEAVLGVFGGDFSVVAGFGKIYIGRFVAKRGWRL